MQTRATHFTSLLFIALWLTFSYSAIGQTISSNYLEENKFLDSLISAGDYEAAIEHTLTTPPDNFQCKILYVLQRNRAYLRQHDSHDEVQRECLEAHKLLQAKDDSLYKYMDARILELLGHFHYQRSNLFIGLTYLDSAAIVYQDIGAHDRSIYNLNMIGTIYYLNDEKAKSIRYYKQALHLFEKFPTDSSYYFEVLNDLGNLYLSLEQLDKAEAYYRSIYENSSINRYPKILANTFANLGNVSQRKEMNTEAIFYYRKAQEQFEANGDSSKLGLIYHNMGALMEDSSANRAMDFYLQSLEIKREEEDTEGIINTLFSIARLEYINGNYANAEKNAFEALELTKATTQLAQKADLYKLIGLLESKKRNWQSAYDYNLKYQEISDSIRLIADQENIYRLEQIYDLERQQEIIDNFEESSEANKARLRKSKVINYALGGASVLLIIVLVLLMQNFQQIQKTKNTLYKKNLEVTAAEALVNGQEQERQRLAHQLHDKVGNHITVLKNHIIAKGTNDDELLRIVQEMSAEVRNISQDLMPPVLERFGLADALEELCSRYRDQTEATIDLNIDQSEMIPMNNDDQINLYRLVQEIIQVSLFQYRANYLLIEMRWNEDGIWVAIEDNGTRRVRTGDDELVIHPWKGIEHRVQFLKGEFKRSSHNQGNEYKVYIPRP